MNDWGAVCRDRRRPSTSARRCRGLEILDRVGGGDSFASGPRSTACSTGCDLDTALAYGVAHGALAMTTPGDTSMATLPEVERLMAGRSARVTSLTRIDFRLIPSVG